MAEEVIKSLLSGGRKEFNTKEEAIDYLEKTKVQAIQADDFSTVIKIDKEIEKLKAEK